MDKKYAQIDINKLYQYKAEGLVYYKQHPIFDLLLWCYLPICQYGNNWNELTKKCRGLVTDFKGNIIANPMPKFFNLEEIEFDNSKNEILPVNDSIKLYEKLDGSLIICFLYENHLIISSKGSFESDQAKKATVLLNTIYKDNLNFFKEGYTYCFEIIYPENRIVNDYGDIKDLFLLSIRNTLTGDELDITNIIGNPFKLPKLYSADNVKDLKELQKQDLKNQEGFVALFSPSNIRVKIKFETYLKLHRLKSETRLIDLWEILKSGKNSSEFNHLLEALPDEYYKQLKEQEQSFISNFNINKKHIIDFYTAGLAEIKENTTRKQQAEYISKLDKKLRPIMFYLLDGKNIDSFIWDLIKPDNISKIF